MLLAQSGIALGLLGMSFCDPRADLWWLVVFALIVAFSSATQDIALDAFRIEATDESLQGATAATYHAGPHAAARHGGGHDAWNHHAADDHAPQAGAATADDHRPHLRAAAWRDPAASGSTRPDTDTLMDTVSVVRGGGQIL